MTVEATIPARTIDRASTTRFASLEIWRGLAALWVLTLHVTPVYYTENPVYKVTYFGQLGVCVFFVISGFCIASAGVRTVISRSEVRQYLFARVRRIYPPYYASCALILFSSVLMSGLVRAHIVHHSGFASASLPTAPKFWISTVTLAQPLLGQEYLSVVFWSLSYEVAFYLIVGLVMWVVLRGSGDAETRLLTGLHLITVVSLIVLILAPNVSRFPFDLWHQFGIGVLLYDWIRGGRQARHYSLTVATLVLIYACRHLSVPVDHGFGRLADGTKSIAALATGALLLATHRWDKPISVSPASRTLMWMGGFSYSLYLFHPTLSVAVERAVRTAGREQQWPFLNFIFVVLSCVLLSYVLHRLFERPFMKRNLGDTSSRSRRELDRVPPPIASTP